MFKSILTSKIILLACMMLFISCVHSSGEFYDTDIGIASTKENFVALTKVQDSKNDAERQHRIRAYFCTEKKPKRAIINRIRVYVPKLQAGISLDEAQSFRTEFLSTAKDAISNFYSIATNLIDFRGHRWGGGALGWENYRPYRVVDRNESDYINDIKTVYRDDFVSGVIPKMNEIAGGIADSGQFQHSSQDEIIRFGYFNKGLISHKLPKQKQMEVSILVENFAFIDSSISTSLKRRENAWVDYLKRNTSVKESVSNNPNIFDFEVSLDLAVFCENARSTSDLLTN